MIDSALPTQGLSSTGTKTPELKKSAFSRHLRRVKNTLLNLVGRRSTPPERYPGLQKLAELTSGVQVCVVQRLDSQAYKQLLGKIDTAEQALLRPVPPITVSTTQQKGHQLQARIHLARIDDTLKAFDRENQATLASKPTTRAPLRELNEHLERLTDRLSQRNALLDRQVAWAAPSPPPSCDLDPITLDVLPSTPVIDRLKGKNRVQALKHVKNLDQQIADLDKQIEQLTGMSSVEEHVFISLRNAMTKCRNAWATGNLKGTTQLLSGLGFNPKRKLLEQELDTQKQLTHLDIALYRLDAIIKTVANTELRERVDEAALTAARQSIIELRTAWESGALNGSSEQGMNPLLIVTDANDLRIKLEMAIIEKSFVQLGASQREQQLDNAAKKAEFKTIISDSNNAPKPEVIRKHQQENKQRALVAELNTDLVKIYQDLKESLALHHIAQPVKQTRKNHLPI